MIIDSHEHVMLPTKMQLENLEKAGVDKAILFCTAPHPERAATLEELKKEMGALYKILAGTNSREDDLNRMRNNIQDLTEIIEKYPDKFYGFGSVPLDLSLEETKNWINTYIISNNLKGVGEFTPGSDKQISQLETVFQALEKYPELPIWIHTFNPVSLSGINILMDITKRHPKIFVIFGHMGGYHWMDVIEFARTVSNVYLDLSAAFSTLAVRMAVTELPDKCLFSSDAPYGDPLLSKQLVEYLSPSEEIKNKILGENILKLLKE